MRRRDGARRGVSEGIEDEDESSGEATVAKVLVGLSLGGMLKPIVRGETGLAALMLSYMLLRNCRRASTMLLCWLSDCRRIGADTVPDVDGRSCSLLLCLAEETDRAGGRSARRAERELPWLEERLCWRPPSLAALMRPGRDIGGACLVPFCGVEVRLSDLPCALLRDESSSRTGALRNG